MKTLRFIILASVLVLFSGLALAQEQEEDEPSVTEENGVIQSFTQLTKDTDWQQVDVVPVNFRTYHPQGMVKIGDHIFVSSVEILKPTEGYETPQDGYDRSPGKGVGHLFKFDLKGNLIDQITLGEGTIYHPGGIDYDGQYIWVPVAEYRPNSESIIYRVDPQTMEATEVFRFPDHIGGIVHNTDTNTLHGVSWGSRRFYRWTLNDDLQVTNANQPPEELRTTNPSYYIDYQDCQYADRSMMLCSGLSNYQIPNSLSFSLGGLELVDLQTGTPVYQLPVTIWTETGRVMTQNPFFAEAHNGGLRLYFMPEDDDSRLFIYDVGVE